MSSRGYTHWAHTWFREAGAPLLVPRVIRAKVAFARSAPLFAWLTAVAVTYTLVWSLLLRIEAGSFSLQDVTHVDIPDDIFFFYSLITAFLLPLLLLPLPWVLSRRLSTAPFWISNLLAALLLPLTAFALSPTAGTLLGAPGGVLLSNFWLALLVCLGLIALVFLGADTLLYWVLKASYRELGSLAAMVSKVLPVLMIAVLFFFVNGDIWRVADALSFEGAWKVVMVLVVLSLLVTISTVVEKTKRLIGARHGELVERFSVEQYTDAASKAGVRWEEALATAPQQKLAEPPVFSMGEWNNLSLLPTLVQAIQALVFGVLVCLFFIWFGTIAIPDSTVTSWLEHRAPNVAFAGLELPVSAVLVKVSMVLGAFAALNFVAQTSSDVRYSDEFLMPIIKEVRQTVILRNIYLAAEHDLVGEEEHKGGNSSIQNTPGAGISEDRAQEAAAASQQAEPERGTN